MANSLFPDPIWKAIRRLEQCVCNLAGGSIYDTDGTLTSNRVLNGGQNKLTFTDLKGFLVEAKIPDSINQIEFVSDGTGTNPSLGKVDMILGQGGMSVKAEKGIILDSPIIALTDNVFHNPGGQVLTTDNTGKMSLTSVPGASPANPSASVGIAAVNGTASTYMRSDAAPAINQAITPTWTGKHIFNAPIGLGSSGSAGNVRQYLKSNGSSAAPVWSSSPNIFGFTRSGDGTTTVFTYPHGIGSLFTPTRVLVTPASADAAGSFYATVDANNITITYLTAPAVGTNNLSWSYLISE